jgi:hypothetical protein
MIGQLREQQFAEDALKGVLRAHPRGNDLVIGRTHSSQPEQAQ